jgi:UDP-glucose 4-epimerase
VTGGGGFVGAPTVRALLEQGAKVRVLDFAQPWRLEGLDCEVVLGDITDREIVRDALDGVDAVAHLAVLPLNQANADPEFAFETNVRGSFTVFDEAGRAGVGRVVYSSASSAYGPTDAYPIVEDHPLRPNAFYPASKAAGEMLLRGLAGLYGFGFLILRYMNVYGPGQRAGVVPAVATALLEGRAPQISCTSRIARTRTGSHSNPRRAVTRSTSARGTPPRSTKWPRCWRTWPASTGSRSTTVRSAQRRRA